MCYVITWVQVCYVISLHKHVMLHTYVQVQVCYALLNSWIQIVMLYTCAQVSYVLTWLQVCYVAHMCTGMLLYMCSVIHLAYIQIYGY